MAKAPSTKSVEAIKHDEAKRKNIPTAEYQSVLQKEQQAPVRVAYDRRNRDLDPQLVWRGKDEQDWSDLIVQAPPLYIQEKVHPKVLIDDLVRASAREAEEDEDDIQPDLFADFNGMPEGDSRTEFYQHDQNWSNRMILGDSLQVMASLAERERLRGKVQMIYIDPPYNSGASDWKYNNDYVDGEDVYRHSKWLAFMERRLHRAIKKVGEDIEALRFNTAIAEMMVFINHATKAEAVPRAWICRSTPSRAIR